MARRSYGSPRVLDAIVSSRDGRLTFKEVADRAAVSPRSVTQIVQDLERTGVLDRQPLRLGPACGYVLALDIGFGDARAALVDANGIASFVFRSPVPPSSSERSSSAPTIPRLLAPVPELVQQVLASAVAEPSKFPRRLLGISCAWASPVRKDGHPFGGILAGERSSLSLIEHLRTALPWAERYELPIRVMSGAVADAFAVTFDDLDGLRSSSAPADERQSVLLVRLDHHVESVAFTASTHAPSSGPLSSMHLWSGHEGRAGGDLGHVHVDESLVRALNAKRPRHLEPLDLHARCSCGATNHLAALISSDAVWRRLSPGAAHHPAWSAGEEAPPELLHAFADVGQLLGAALHVATAVLAPDSIYLSGPLGHPLVAEGVRRTLWDTQTDRSAPLADLRTVEDQPVTTLRGAALPVLRERVYRMLALAQEPDWNSVGPQLEQVFESPSVSYP